MDELRLLEWPAMVITMAAAWFLASRRSRRRHAGFWLFLFSNVLWMGWASRCTPMPSSCSRFAWAPSASAACTSRRKAKSKARAPGDRNTERTAGTSPHFMSSDEEQLRRLVQTWRATSAEGDVGDGAQPDDGRRRLPRHRAAALANGGVRSHGPEAARRPAPEVRGAGDGPGSPGVGRYGLCVDTALGQGHVARR